MSLKIGDKVRTKGFDMFDLLFSGLRNGVTGRIESLNIKEDGRLFVLVRYTEGQENLPNSKKYGKLAGEYLLKNLRLDEPMSLEPERGFYVGQEVRLKGIVGSKWAILNKVTDGTRATIKGFYTCDHCDYRHIALDVDGREVLGIVFENIEAITSNVA